MRTTLVLLALCIVAAVYADADFEQQAADGEKRVLALENLKDELGFRGGKYKSGKGSGSSSSSSSKVHHHVYRPQVKPQLMDTSHECCKDILKSITSLQDELLDTQQKTKVTKNLIHDVNDILKSDKVVLKASNYLAGSITSNLTSITKQLHSNAAVVHNLEQALFTLFAYLFS